METAIAMMQTHIETIAKTLTISSEGGDCLLPKNPHLFPIRNAQWLSKTTMTR